MIHLPVLLIFSLGQTMSGFSTFVPSMGYPQKSSHFLSPPGVPLPTNSWAQNTVKGTVFREGTPPGVFPLFPPLSRDTKPLPWFVSPYYGDGDTPVPFITLGHITVGNITHSNQEGQNFVAIDPRGFIDQVTSPDPGATLDLTKLDDGSLMFTFSDGTIFYASRGSPFVNFFSVLPTVHNFLISSSVTLLGPTAIMSEIRGAFHFIEIPFSRNQLTTSVTTSYPVDGVYNFTISIWSRYTLVGEVRVEGLVINGQPVSGMFFVDDVLVAQFTPEGFSSTQGATYDIPTKTITVPGGISIDLSGAPLFIVRYTETVLGVLRFISNGPFTASRSGGTLTVPTGPNNVLWIYCNDNREYYTDPQLGYVWGAIIQQGMAGSYTLALTTRVGPSIYFYVPRWWRDDYNITGLTYPSDIVYDVTYGDCILAVTQQANLVFTPKILLPLPTSPTIPEEEVNLQAFRERIVADTAYYGELTLEAYKLQTCYVFGQNIAKYGRILTFAHLAQVLTGSMSASFISLLESWLNETNGQVPGSAPGSNTFKLETTWGGVINIADYNVKLGIAGEGSFGNSFYNDHHFQYGYFFAALYSLYIIEDTSLLVTYQNQIRELLQDVVTAYGDATSISTKTRHKDWYSGHSFATGLTIAVDIDQESVSEAINCYYQAWLLCGAMFSLTADVRFQNMLFISEAALYTEIYASRYFWTQNGESIQAPSTTIVQAFSKTFKAFSGGQPASYPSTSLYRYSIITLPFTDITPLFIDRDWVQRYSSTATPLWQRADRDLIAGFTNYEKLDASAWHYEPHPSPYDIDDATNPEGITSWGLVGLQSLALGGALTREEALRYYNKVNFKAFDLQLPLDEDIIKRFDSFSNIFYVLYQQADFNELGPVEGPELEPEVQLQGKRKKPSKKRLVEVPTIQILALPDESGLGVERVIFEVTDVIDYTECGSSAKVYDNCIPTGLVPRRDVIISEFILVAPKCNFDSILNERGSVLLGKCRNLNSIAPYIIQYVYIRWILARLLYGSFKLKYLRRNFTEKFMRDLARSRFHLFFSEYFNSIDLIDYNGLGYNVVGYGSSLQHGEFYFVE